MSILRSPVPPVPMRTPTFLSVCTPPLMRAELK